jgi:putative ABC transport system ATP-binding protein
VTKVAGSSTADSAAAIIRAIDVGRVFPMPAGPVAAVLGVSLSIAPGDHVAVRGPSGCGKSTLLHMLGCVETPTSGALLFDNQNVASLSDAARSRLRLRHIGFVFQRFFLLPMLTAGENVELPQSEAGMAAEERRRRTRELLDYVGLAARADHRPAQLSGGEMQRVAIARALANRPRLLLADEPTGELDQATGAQIAQLLDRVNADGTALVIVTHDPALAQRARRILTMRDGQIESETTRTATRDRAAATTLGTTVPSEMAAPGESAPLVDSISGHLRERATG